MSPQNNYPLDYDVKHIHFHNIFLVRQLAHFELNTEDFEPGYLERENKKTISLPHIYACILLVYQSTHIGVKTEAFQGSKKLQG